MVWTKKENVAQYEGASWENWVHKESNCTAAKARRIAIMKPEVTFYFFCREDMVLAGHGSFNPGDAVFFKGESRLGEKPQCDTYTLNGLAVAYINPDSIPVSIEEFKKLASVAGPSDDGLAGVDIVCIFAANYCTYDSPMLRAKNNQPTTEDALNKNIEDIVKTSDVSPSAVKFLQDKGIVVLLTVLNGRGLVGWSQFHDEIIAQDFVNYLKTDIIEEFGLDGIDIDDEYSNGTPHNESLAMVTTLMKKTMPDKLVTKALGCGDSGVFESKWNGHKLGKNLDYGWQMSYTYGASNKKEVQDRLLQYTKFDMPAKTLCLGFSAESRFDQTYETVFDTMKHFVFGKPSYGGGMLFNYKNNPNLLNAIIDSAC